MDSAAQWPVSDVDTERVPRRVPPGVVRDIADRFGMPPEWAARHVGEHVCVDGRRYYHSCLVSDPACHETAAALIGRSGKR